VAAVAVTPLHEVLINPSGKAQDIWVVREPKCTPPWPELRESIRKALQEQLYEPATLDGKPVATCAQVLTNINWR
jgi:hypothetical protein